jgi:hypothetical protein
MNMIGHHHVSADGDVANPVRVLGEFDECRVHRIGREQFSPLVCTKCDEEQGIVSEDPPQARREFWIFAHGDLVAASLGEAQCRCSFAALTSPVGRRLQEPEVPIANGSFLERNTRPPFSGRIVVDRKELFICGSRAHLSATSRCRRKWTNRAVVTVLFSSERLGWA